MPEFFLFLGLVFVVIGVIIVTASLLRRGPRKAKTGIQRPLSHGGNLYIFVG